MLPIVGAIGKKQARDEHARGDESARKQRFPETDQRRTNNNNNIIISVRREKEDVNI